MGAGGRKPASAFCRRRRNKESMVRTRICRRLDARDQGIWPRIGQILTDQMLELGGSGDAIEAIGKASMAGLEGELEHASAIIHTVNYGNALRKAVGGTAYLGFTNSRGPANTQINIPLMDKNDTGRRSHYLTIQMHIHDAPANHELIVAFGGSTGGRPHHRIGDRYSDLAALGADLDNPAGV